MGAAPQATVAARISQDSGELLVLPLALVRAFFGRRRGEDSAVVGYLHPYDLDVEQERFAHPGLGDRRWMNALMYVNRHRVIPRLTRLLADGWRLERYCDYVNDRLESRVRIAE